MYPHTIEHGGDLRFIKVDCLGNLAEHRFRKIQERLAGMLENRDKTIVGAALHCLDRSQGYCSVLSDNERAILVQLGYIQDDHLIDEIFIVGRAGFEQVSPETEGHLRGYRVIDPFGESGMKIVTPSPPHVLTSL